MFIHNHSIQEWLISNGIDSDTEALNLKYM